MPAPVVGIPSPGRVRAAPGGVLAVRAFYWTVRSRYGREFRRAGRLRSAVADVGIAAVLVLGGLGLSHLAGAPLPWIGAPSGAQPAPVSAPVGGAPVATATLWAKALAAADRLGAVAVAVPRDLAHEADSTIAATRHLLGAPAGPGVGGGKRPAPTGGVGARGAGRGPRTQPRGAASGPSGTAGASGSTTAPGSATHLAGNVRVDILPGGSGRAVLVVTGGQAMLVDGGSPRIGDAVVSRLRALGIPRLAAAVLTSGRAGTALGLVSVLNSVPVERVLDLVPGSSCPAHTAVLDAARAQGAPVRPAERGASVSLGAAKLEVLWPSADLAQPGALPSQPGLVRLVVGSVRMLLAGGIDPVDLQAVQRLGPDLGAQVLEVPDHAAPDSLAPAFLHAVAPRLAIIEPAAGVAPDTSILQRLAAAHVTTVEASRAADLRLQTDGHGLILGFDPGLPGQPAPSNGGASPESATGPCG